MVGSDQGFFMARSPGAVALLPMTDTPTKFARRERLAKHVRNLEHSILGLIEIERDSQQNGICSEGTFQGQISGLLNRALCALDSAYGETGLAPTEEVRQARASVGR